MSGKVDLEKIARKLEFDIEDVEMLIEVFLESTEETLVNLKKAILANDYEEIHRLSHAIKGSSANLTLEHIAEIAKNMELEARVENKIDYLSCYEKLTEQIETIK